MAVTTAQKQAWLQSHGKPKSYSYFMTGPNLGPDWDWNKAVGGYYKPYEVDGFLSQGETHYKAHKGKSKKKAPNGGGLGPAAGTSTNCASTAAKAVTSWVADSKMNVMEWWTSIGKAMTYAPASNTAPNLGYASFRTKINAHIVEATKELGDQADEVIALKQMRDLMDDVEVARKSILQKESALLAVEDSGMISALKDLEDARKLLNQSQSLKLDKAASLFDEWNDPVAGLQFVREKARETVITQQRVAIGGAWKRIAYQQHDEWLELGWAQNILGQIPSNAYDDVQKALELLEAKVAFVDDVATVIDATNKLTQFTAMWERQFAYEQPLNIAHQAFKGMGELAERTSNIVTEYLSAFDDVVQQYQSVEYWLAGPTGGISGSPLETLVLKYPGQPADELLLHVQADIGEVAFNVQTLADTGVWPVPDIGSSIVKQIEGYQPGVSAVLDSALDGAKAKLPGFTPTKDEVLATLEQGHVAAMQAAGTDELNPLVQLKLEEDYGQQKTLTYFMTKDQKVDILLLPKETFEATEYVVKYKGDTLTGKGLLTSQAKYDIKNGKIKTLTPVQASEQITETVSDAVTGATETWTAPPGSPKWWSEPVTDPQQYVITKEINKGQSFGFAVSNLPDSVQFKLVDGSLTKGQASSLIDKIKSGKTNWTEADIDSALSYGQKKQIITGNDAIKAKIASDPEPLVDEVMGAVQAVESGPAVSGAAQVSSSAAPKNVAWDEPHTFTYVGDGSKWGGAHRKWHFTDENGSDWMLKNDSTTFRAEGELAAHRIGHLAGFDIAEARVTTQTVSGSRKKGFMQKMFRKSDIKGELADFMPNGSFVGVDDDIVRQVQEHQILDWLIGNHDGHKQNFLVLKDGRVVGIDKGQAFKFLGKDELSATYQPNGNFGEITYNRMWQEYRAGKLNLDLDSIADALRRVEAIDDDVYRETIRQYAEGRFAARGSEAFLQGTTAKSVDEFVELALERKRQIRKQFTEFYQDNADARGITWSPSWTDDVVEKAATPFKPATVYKAGDVLTPLDDAFSAALQRAGSQGKAIYVAGADVERGQMLYDIVADSNGNQVLRLHARLRPDADQRVMKLLKEEGGDQISAGASIKAPTPSTPIAVQTITGEVSAVKSAAKTINHHISTGDFEFNKSSIEAVKNLKVKFASQKFPDLGRADLVPQSKIDEAVKYLTGATSEQIEAELVTYFDDIAAEVVARKAQTLVEKHLDNIIEQAAKGNAAAKVPHIPEFDAVAEFTNIRNFATEQTRKALKGKAAEAVVEVVEPDKLFLEIKTGTFKTTKTIKGSGVGAERRVAKLEIDVPDAMEGGSQVTIIGKTADDVEVLYSPHQGNNPTDKGFIEILVRTDGEVTTADIERAYEVTRRMGVDAALADVEQMELTYWRTVHGTYRNSKEAGQVSSKYYKVLELGDQNLKALGPNPTPASEIEAIKSAYRQIFGKHVDEADFLPVHKHAFAEHLEEVGWGRHTRPEITADDLVDLDSYNIIHTFTGGKVDSSYFQGAMRDGMHGGAERRRIGYWKPYGDSMSASADVPTGGSSSMFFRISSTRSGARENQLVVDPKSTARFLGNYTSPMDRYGNIELRTQLNRLDPRAWGEYARASGNEFMLRDMVTWVDDAEVVFFPNETQAKLVQTLFKDSGLGVLRGVKVEERFVAVSNPGTYLTDFRNKYLKGKLQPLRWTQEAIRSGTQQVSQVARKTAASLSRLKVKAGNQLGKKLSAGRQGALQLGNLNTTYGSKWGWIGVRKHATENALSFSVKDMKQIGWIPDVEGNEAAEIKGFMDALGIKKWAHGGDQAFKVGRSTHTAGSIVVDLSEWGVDIGNISKYEQDRVLREFAQAVNDGNLKDFALKWSTI